MAKKITRNDISEEDIFKGIRDSAEATLVVLDKMEASLKESANIGKGKIQKIDPKSLSDLKEFNGLTTEGIKVQKEAEKLAQEKARTQKILAQTDEALVKIAEKKIKAQKDEASAYAKLSKELNNNRKAYKDLAVQNKENTAEGQALLKNITELDKKLKDVDATVGQHQRNVGNYTEATTNLKKELRALTLQLQNMDESNPDYDRLVRQAGQYRDQIQDTTNLIKATAGSGLENFSKGLAGIGKVGIGAFQGIESSMALMGVESEKVQETLMRIQALAGLSDALETLGGLGDTFKEIKASIKGAWVSLVQWVATKRADIVVTTAQTTATTGATFATKALGFAMKALPIVAIIAGIGALVYALSNWNTKSKAQEEQTKKNKAIEEALNKERKASREFIAKESAEYVGLIMQLKSTNANSKERRDLISQINSQYGTTLKNLSDEEAFQRQLNLAVKEYIEFQRNRFKLQQNEERIQRNLETQEKIRYDMQKARNSLLLAEVQLTAKKNQLSGANFAIEKTAEFQAVQKLKNEIAGYETELDKAEKRLESYGITALKLNEQTEGKYIPTKQKETKVLKDLNKEKQKEIEKEIELAELDAERRRQRALDEKDRLDAIDLEIEQKAKDEALRKEIEDELKQEKALDEKRKKEEDDRIKRQEVMNNIVQVGTDFFIKKSNERIAQLDKEIQASEQHYETLKTLAENGNINAKESLELELQNQIEANKQKEKELKKQQRIELIKTAYSTYQAKVQSGSKQPLADTIKDVAMLNAFVASLPTFFDGTEDTGKGGGVDGKGGFLSVLHPNERVVPKAINEKLGGISNQELGSIAEQIKLNNMPFNKGILALNFGTDKIVERLDSLENAIKNKPETNIQLESIVNGAMTIVRQSKGNGQVITNRYKVRS
jgi:hypothetical protein